MKEKKDREAPVTADIPARIFRLLLDFAENGYCLPPDDVIGLMELYITADYYLVTKCAEWTRLRLVQALGTANLADQCTVFERFSNANTPNATSDATIFKCVCGRMILGRPEQLMGVNGWQKLGKQPAKVQELLCMVNRIDAVRKEIGR
ncbi:hypothetical protein HK097_004140 [Rhizophlyctis rosea]|uniref:Uncharacterized protein n=1 Tax=Rhizophlyctis rosea TaxID=64517 RepID=A0AAD5X3M6_9FUNG|nr:hypothetical protein HK097_004140 [Rhizophlyctis rosea]